MLHPGFPAIQGEARPRRLVRASTDCFPTVSRISEQQALIYLFCLQKGIPAALEDPW